MAPKPKKLSPAEITEFSELFAYYDKAGKGTVSAAQVPEMVRSCGMSPTETEMKRLVAKLNKSGKTKLNLVAFLKLLETSEFSTRSAKDDVLSAFRVYAGTKDAPSGYISRADFITVMTKFGDSLSKKEMDKLLEAVDKSKVDVDRAGNINFRDFVSKVLML